VGSVLNRISSIEPRRIRRAAFLLPVQRRRGIARTARGIVSRL